MSDQVSALGIKVEAEGVEEAAKKIAILSRHINDAQEDVERAQQGVAELAAANAAAIKEAQAEIKDAQKGVKDLADANAAAIKDTDKAMIALKHSGRLFADGCAEMDERLAELKQQIVSIPDELPISTDEQTKELKNYGAAVQDVAGAMGGVADAAGAAIGAIKNFQNSIIAAYRPLEQAQQQLKFFSDDAKKTTEIMAWLDDAANRWGQSTTTLTQVSTMLTRKNIDVKQNLETIVKLAAASSQDLMATAQTYVSALQGDEGALKSLDETYRISESDIKAYSVALDEAGKISGKTAKDQAALKAALDDIVNTKYGDAIAKQQETLAGSMQRMQTSVQNLKQTFGAVLAPAVTEMTNSMASVVGLFKKLPPDMQKGIVQLTVFGGTVATTALAMTQLAMRGAKVAQEILTVNAALAGSSNAMAGLSGAAIAFKQVGLIGLFTTLSTTIGTVTNDIINLYNETEKLKGDEIKAETAAFYGFKNSTNDLNKALKETGLQLKDIGDAAAREKMVKFFADPTEHAVNLHKVVKDLGTAIDYDTKKAQELNEAIVRRQMQLEMYKSGNSVNPDGSVNQDYYNIKTEIEGFGGYGGRDISEIENEVLGNRQALMLTNQRLEKAKAAQQLAKDAIKTQEELRRLEQKKLKLDADQLAIKAEQDKKDQERAAAIRSQLEDITEDTKALTPTADGIAKVEAIAEAYMKVGRQNESFILSQKELTKSYQSGLKALAAQADALTAAKIAADQRAAAEKEFSASAAKQEELKSKSLKEQSAGIGEIISKYKELLAVNDAFKDNAENRKRAEEYIKTLTQQRLEIEEKIANLQLTAAQKLQAAEIKRQELVIQRLEAEKTHLTNQGKTAEAQQAEKDLAEAKKKLKEMQDARDIKAVTSEYQTLIDQAKGTPAEKELRKALNLEIENIKTSSRQGADAAQWQAEDAATQKAKEEAEAAQKAEAEAKKTEASASDKTAQSIIVLGAAADKTAQKLNAKGTAAGSQPAAPDAAAPSTASAIDMHKPAQVLPGTNFGPKKQEYQIPASEQLAAYRRQLEAGGMVLPSVGTPMTMQQVQNNQRSRESRVNNFAVNINMQKTGGAASVDEQRLVELAEKVSEKHFKEQFEANSINP